MARLPRYQRAGVRTRQPQAIEFAGIREQAQLGQQISRSFDEMSQFLYKTGAEEAERRGIERIRTEGAQPVLEALREQGGPRTIAEKAAYEAGNRVAVAEIQAEADLEITRILNEGQKNKTSFSAIQAQLKDVTDGFPAALSNIDPVSAGVLRTRLTEASGKAEMRYSKWWTGEQTKLRKEKQNRVSANEAEFIIGNATVPGYTVQEIELDIESGSKTLTDLGVKPELVAEWADGVRKKAIKEKTVFEFYQKPVEEQREEIKSILSGDKTLPGMDFEESVRFVNGSLRSEYNRNVAAVKAQSDYVVNKIEDQQEVLEDGGRLSQEILADLNNAVDEILTADPQRGPALQSAMKSLQETDEFFSGLRSLSLTDAEATVFQLQSGMEGRGGEGIDTVLEQKRYEQASKFLDNMRTQISKDPMGYAERVGFIQNVEQVITFDENRRPVINESAMRQRQIQAQSVANHYGLAVPRVLFGDEARQIGLYLNQMEGVAKLDMLGALASFDQVAGQVLTDIAEYNPEMALVGALVNEGRIETANIAIAGFERLKLGEKPAEFTTTNIDEVHSQFGRAITTPKHHAAVKEVAKAIYTEMAVSKGVFTFDANLYEQAYQMAAGQTVRDGKVYGGIQEVRGMQTFVMPGMTGDQLEQYLNEISVDVIQSATGQQISGNLAEQIKENESYRFRNVGGNKYSIEYGDKGEAFVLDADGRPVIIDITQLQKSFGLILPEVSAPAMGTAQPMPTSEEITTGITGLEQITEISPAAAQAQPGLRLEDLPEELEFVPGSKETRELKKAIESISESPRKEIMIKNIERMLDSIEGVRNRKSTKAYKQMIRRKMAKNPTFFMSYDDWLKTQ
jgi:hypothetical protein